MKILLVILSAVMLASLSAAEGEPNGPKIVIQFTSEGPKQNEAVLNNIENLFSALGDKAEVIVIAHGPGLGILAATNSVFATRMEKLSRTKTTFVACENTMKRKQITKADLLSFVKTVDSGIAEVVRRQRDGWAYIKGGY